MTTIFCLEGPADTIDVYYSYFLAMSDLAIVQPEEDRLEAYPQFYVYQREISEGEMTFTMRRIEGLKNERD